MNRLAFPAEIRNPIKLGATIQTVTKLFSCRGLLFIAIGMTAAWIIFAVGSISVAQRLSLDESPQLDKKEATYYFGYLTSGYETTSLFSHQPLQQDRWSDVTRMRCWVDWSSCENPPWWTRFPIRGYAVVAGQIEHSAIPKFGHFGQDKHVLRATHALLPPVPVAL